MRATPLPDHALLTREQWLELGVGARRLAGEHLVRLFPGLHTSRAAPADLETMCRILQTVIVPGAVLSHTTAAVLYGLPVPYDADDGIGTLLRLRDPDTGRRRLTLQVLRDDPDREPLTARQKANPSPADIALQVPHLHCRVPPGVRARAGKHVTVHRMQPGNTRRLHGLLLSSPGELLLELAQILEHDEVVIVLDHVLGPQDPFGVRSRARLRELLLPYTGRRGFRALQQALADAREDVESPGETRTRLLLRRAGFPEPTPNLPVFDPDAKITRRIDNAYEDLKIAVEYDGDGHRSRGAWRADRARQDSLESIGWTFRRLTMNDIREPARLLTAVRRSFLAVGAAAPPVSRWSGSAAMELSRPRPRPGSPRRH